MSKCFHCDRKLYRTVTVYADKLIVLKLDNITLYICDNFRYFIKLSWYIRQ